MGEGRSIGFTFYAKDNFDPVARRVAASMDRVRSSLDSVSSAAKRSNKVTTTVNRDWSSFANNAKRLAATYLGAQTIRHVLSETASAETALLRVMSAIRDPADQVAYHSKIETIIKANRALGFSLDEVSESLTLQIQNMGASEKALASFSAGSRLATAAFQPLGASVDAVNSLADAYPDLAKNPDRGAQILFTTRQLTKDYGGLVSTLPQVSQLSARAGLTPERQMALFATLANESKTSGAAGSAMYEIIRTLSVKGNPKQDALLRRLKIDASPKGLAEAGLEKQLQRLSLVAQKSPALMSDLGISDSAQKVLLTLDNADIGKIEKLESAIRSDMEKNTIGPAFDRVTKSMTGSFNDLKKSLDSLSGIIGSELAPSVKKIAGVVGGVTAGLESPTAKAALHAFMSPPTHRRNGDDSFIGDVLSAPLDAIIAGVRAYNGKGASNLDPGARPKEP